MENYIETIKISEYLTRRNIEYWERGNELVTKCIFNKCDEDSRAGEGHLYFNIETSQYECKKCGEKGNIFTLAEFFGDSKKDVIVGNSQLFDIKKKKGVKKLSVAEMDRYNQQIPERIEQYLISRGINEEVIEKYKLGWGNFYGHNFITIPIFDNKGEPLFFKLRLDPEDSSDFERYMSYPTGHKGQLYGWNSIDTNENYILICEGELDRLVLESNGIPAITLTTGVKSFIKQIEEKYLNFLRGFRKIYLILDKDETGEEGTKDLSKLLNDNLDAEIYIVKFPERMKDGKDVSDYFSKYCGSKEELIDQLSVPYGYKTRIDTSQFGELDSDELMEVLGLTIKKDNENKLVAFLCMLSAYTDNSQFNISFNAPSSTGKSYIPIEIAEYFPKKDVVKIGYVTPTAFFHDTGKEDKKKKGYVVDLSKKILIFLDQPHNALLERLRPILSHDEKEMHLKITDKNQKMGLRTKNVFIKGFPSVVFCSAGLNIDEQEGTRFILLSPETTQEKLRESINIKIDKNTNEIAYNSWIDSDSKRKELQDRIIAIKQANIKTVIINNKELVKSLFLDGKKRFQPRHQRDIGRFISIIKVIALLNLWLRECEDGILVANDDDIKRADKIWKELSRSQEYNLPPFIFDIFINVIKPCYLEKGSGLTRKELMDKHYEKTGRIIGTNQWRMYVLPMLETAGLIIQEPDPDDKRLKLVVPTDLKEEENNSSNEGGVTFDEAVNIFNN